jgi:hypothetical protein
MRHATLRGSPKHLHALAATLRGDAGPVWLGGIDGAQIVLRYTDSSRYRVTMEQAALIVAGSGEMLSRWFLDALDGVASSEVEPLGEEAEVRVPDSLTLVIVATTNS